MLTIERIEQRLNAYQPRQRQAQVARHAAVAMLLRDRGRETEVMFIRRAEHDKDPWSGDLGFPGGGIEPLDSSPRTAAERETWEEVGLRLHEKNYLGQNDDLIGAYLSVRISCFVYHIDREPAFTTNGEVVDLFWVPFTTLLDPERNRMAQFHYRGSQRKHPIIDLSEWSSRPLWGITYRLIDNFLRLFDYSFKLPERR